MAIRSPSTSGATMMRTSRPWIHTRLGGLGIYNRVAPGTPDGRHRTHTVPTTHLGNPLAGSDPVTFAEAGLEFYRREVEEIARLFR
jgi:hypothetical protein